MERVQNIEMLKIVNFFLQTFNKKSGTRDYASFFRAQAISKLKTGFFFYLILANDIFLYNMC